jgi:hypothetical protein
MSDGTALRPFAEPLRLAALEIGDLARMADDLQDLIARLAEAARPDAEVMARAQACDFLSQRLAGMAAFLHALASAAPSDAVADVHAAVMGLTLAEQARRLAGPAAPSECPMQGELTLFGT